MVTLDFDNLAVEPARRLLLEIYPRLGAHAAELAKLCGEDVYPLDSQTLLVINNNNCPFSSGRRPGKAPDDNEFFLLHVPTRLRLN